MTHFLRFIDPSPRAEKRRCDGLMLRVMSRKTLIAAFLAVLALAGCRGMESSEPPIHPNLNMDFQERFDPQEPNPFFEDGMAMRTPVPGTVARGMLREDTRFYEGRTEQGELVERLPVPVTRELLERGQERYNIYCAVCHGRTGDGEGIITAGDYGYTQAPTYHDERLREVSDGYLYDVITNGVRTMPGYAHQVPVADRWAIVAYMRALQRSQYATEEDLPSSVLAQIEQGRSANIEGGRQGVGGAEEGDTAAAAPEEEVQPPAEEEPVEEAPEEEEVPEEEAPTEDPAEEEVAEGETEEAEAPEEEAPAEEQEEDTAAAEEDTAAAQAEEDTTATAAAETEAGAPGEEAQVQEGERTTGGVISSTVLILILVVLPILALLALLVIAFRREREH